MNKTWLWVKRIGLLGFSLFLLKGLIWIAIFMGVGNWIVGLFK